MTNVNAQQLQPMSADRARFLYVSQKRLMEKQFDAITTRMVMAEEDLITIFPNLSEKEKAEYLEKVLEREISKAQDEEDILVERFIAYDEAIVSHMRMIPKTEWHRLEGIVPTTDDEKLVGLMSKARTLHLKGGL